MPIPELINGMLPAGVWDCSLADIEARFGGFDRTQTRRELCRHLKAYLEEARGVGLIRAVCVDGSFVTDKPEPNDLDIIVSLASDQDENAELRPFEYNATSKRSIRRRYKFDVAIVKEGSPQEQESLAFFALVRERPGDRKGLLRIIP